MKKISVVEREITFWNGFLTLWPNRSWVFNMMQPALKECINTAKMTRAGAVLAIVIGVMLDVRELFYVNFSGDDWLLGQSSLFLFDKIL